MTAGSSSSGGSSATGTSTAAADPALAAFVQSLGLADTVTQLLAKQEITHNMLLTVIEKVAFETIKEINEKIIIWVPRLMPLAAANNHPVLLPSG